MNWKRIVVMKNEEGEGEDNDDDSGISTSSGVDI